MPPEEQEEAAATSVAGCRRTMANYRSSHVCPRALREPQASALAFHLQIDTYTGISISLAGEFQVQERDGNFVQFLPPSTSSMCAALRISAAATTAQHRVDEEEDDAGFNIFDLCLCLDSRSRLQLEACLSVCVYIVM
jgi:hypothetical protein